MPGTADALQAIRQGANLKIIGAVVNNLQVMVIRGDVLSKLNVSPEAPVADRVRALKGLIIGTGAVGSTHYQILRSYLKQYGIDPDNDVRLVGMGETGALVGGIEQKRYDAIAYASPIVDFAIAKGIAKVWISGPRGDVPGAGNVKTCVIVARADTVEKRRADVDAMRAALADASGAVRNDHAATGRLLHDQYFPDWLRTSGRKPGTARPRHIPTVSPSPAKPTTTGSPTIQKARTATRKLITRGSPMLPLSQTEATPPLLRLDGVAVRFNGVRDVLAGPR